MTCHCERNVRHLHRTAFGAVQASNPQPAYCHGADCHAATFTARNDTHTDTTSQIDQLDSQLYVST